MRVIRLTIPSGKYLFTKVENKLSLMEFCKRFSANMDEVRISDDHRDKVLRLGDVVTVLNNSDSYIPPEIPILEGDDDESRTDNHKETVRTRAKKIRDRIRDELMSGRPLSVGKVCDWAEEYTITGVAMSLHFKTVRTQLINEDYNLIRSRGQWRITNLDME